MREVFVQTWRRRSEVCAKKNPEGKYFPVQTEQTRLIRLLLYSFWFIFSSVFSAVFVFRCCSLTYLRAYWFSSMFTTLSHSFASIINKQLSRKPILMFQDVLLFEIFQQTYLILFYFYLNQLRNVTTKTYQTGKKRIAISHRPRGQYEFFQTSQRPISMRYDLKVSSAI